MKKETMTEYKAKQTPAGGVLVGKREGQTIIHDKGTQGGYFVGKLHKEGGIKGINKSTGQPIEVQGGEVIITAPAVADQTKREFEGEMLTNREILSKINQKGGGVSLENGGEIYYTGSSYNYGGKTMTDYEIMQSMNDCGCEHEYKEGGGFIDGYEVDYFETKRGVYANIEIPSSNSTFEDDIQIKGFGKTEKEAFEDLKKEYVRNWIKVNPQNFAIGGYNAKTIWDFKNTKEGMDYVDEEIVDKAVGIYVGGKVSKVDANELKLKKGGGVDLIEEDVKTKVPRDFSPNTYDDIVDVHTDGITGGKTGFELGEAIGGADASFADGGGLANNYYTDKSRFPNEGEIILPKDVDYDMMSFFYRTNKKLSITLKNGEKVKSSVGKFYNDLIFHGENLPKKIEYSNYTLQLKEFEKIKLIDSDVHLDFLDDAVKQFDDGGATLSAEVFEWDKVPTNYRNISKVKKVPFSNNPMDKGLDSIISPFLGKDELRPSLTGINFDENGITATDGHILITLPYPNDKYNGIYDITGAKKQKSKDLLLIYQNYPNYSAVIPKSENAGTPYEVDVYKLLQYTKTALNYSNKIYKGVTYKFGDNEAIGLNGNYFPNFLNALLKLGHEKVYAFISYPTKALVFSPNKNYELGNDDILLIMPSVVEYGYGAEDKDTNRSLRAYYDFNDNEIHNADGSVAEFKMKYENNQLVDDNYLALLSKMTSKKVYLPILQYVKVEGGKMTATDLEISLVVKDVNMPNGIYEIVNKAPNITMNPIEDFPSERVFDKGEYETHWKEKRETAFEFVTFSEVFEFYLDKLLLSVGKDDLRPVMSGICIKKTAQNEMFLVTTNAHTLCKINITEYCEFDKDSRELEYILPVKYLKDFVKLADGSLHFKCSMANIFIEADNLDFIGRTIDGKYPNYDAVIPRDSTKKIVFDHVAMNKCLKSPEMTNLIAKYKGRKDITFDFFNIGNSLNIKVSQNKGYNVQSELIETIELCKIDLNYKEVENTLSLDQSAFLLMPSKDNFKENQYFSFRKEFFDVMLETITDTEVDCYFSEPNRAYVFPIDAIDYKKTLPEEKTKQQKLSKKDLEQIVELEDMKEVLESNELQEAIETLEMLLETLKGKDKKEVKEALEIIKMLNEN
jgi:DNA polymerase III sliding clamp (beta) subunit (PCNA family)